MGVRHFFFTVWVQSQGQLPLSFLRCTWAERRSLDIVWGRSILVCHPHMWYVCVGGVPWNWMSKWRRQVLRHWCSRLAELDETPISFCLGLLQLLRDPLPWKRVLPKRQESLRVFLLWFCRVCYEHGAYSLFSAPGRLMLSAALTEIPAKAPRAVLSFCSRVDTHDL